MEAALAEHDIVLKSLLREKSASATSNKPASAAPNSSPREAGPVGDNNFEAHGNAGSIIENEPIGNENVSAPVIPPSAADTAASSQAPAFIKREHSPPVIDLTGDDDDDAEFIKHEHDENVARTQGDDNGHGGLGTDTDVWWPGKLAASVAVEEAEEHEDDGVWWPGKLKKLKLISRR
jgi:hypothetical protein